MRVKHYVVHKNGQVNNQSIVFHFTPEEMSYMYKDMTHAKGYRVGINFVDGFLTIIPYAPGITPVTASWSVFAQESSRHPWKVQIGIKNFPGIDLAAYETLQTVEVRKTGGQLNAFLEVMTEDVPETVPASNNAPVPTRAQSPVDDMMQKPSVETEAANPLTAMLENAYNVNPSDRSVLKAALAILNDNIRRSKGAVHAQINPQTGEVQISVAQFHINMESL